MALEGGAGLGRGLPVQVNVRMWAFLQPVLHCMQLIHVSATGSDSWTYTLSTGRLG